ncbi:protein phosphatase 2C domain-containing protein [Kitasatospora purpeofusca]|uniref:PP2C family protein-serine/threonine phosphatase n=1 Tax=Kitasatospora purpeofusca TaxID=67352 RepID=UPI002E15EDFA|nr:protein phosphatase 2C domain-containing protein [Kitasatospora purpeofusca]
MSLTFALFIDPDGEVDELDTPNSGIEGQHRMVHSHLGKGYSTVGLGRFVLHCTNAPFPQQVNIPAQQMWKDLSGGSLPPVFRGPVVVTGRRRPDGSYPLLPADQLDRLHRSIGAVPWTEPKQPVISAAQDKGTRGEQCDAVAVHTDHATGVWAFVVCDGVEDHVEARWAAHHLAQRIAIVAAETGDPEAAVNAARQDLPTWRLHFCSETKPTATVAAAVWHPRRGEITVAWAGNVRVYAMGATGLVEQLTVDHTVAEFKESRNAPVQPGDEDRLLAHVGEGPVEVLRVYREWVSRLLLCTDGAYGPVERRLRGGVVNTLALMPPKEAAGALVVEGVRAAVERSEDEWGEADAGNATALVVDLSML